jgi:ABC-2 type transport system ATP-binding protein
MSSELEKTAAITARGLQKTYAGDVEALRGVDLTVPRNSIYALLGPNGAGKTTTLSILTTLLLPTGGTAVVAGHDVVAQPHEVRRRIGVTFQEIVLDPDLTGRETLEFHGRLYQMPAADRAAKIDELLALVELQEAADRMTKTYSGGMKRRLELARGLMTSPEILFLDEPTQGLDPQNRTNIWEYIRNLQEQTNTTLLLTTHYMDEAAALADEVAIIDQGRVVAHGAPQALVDSMGADGIHVHGQGDGAAFRAALEAAPFVETINQSETLMQIGVDAGSKRLVDVINLANQNGFTIAEDISSPDPVWGMSFYATPGASCAIDKEGKDECRARDLAKQIKKSLVHKEEVFGMLIQPVLWVVLFGVGMRSMMGGMGTAT